MTNDRKLPPIDCDECKKGFHPSLIYKTKNGKNICRDCIIKLSFRWLFDEAKKRRLNEIKENEYLKKTLNDAEYTRYLNNIQKE